MTATHETDLPAGVVVRIPLRAPHVFRQVLAYAWLDSPPDHYRIRAVALICRVTGCCCAGRSTSSRPAARAPGTGGTGVAAVREEFLAAAAAAAARDGATVPLEVATLTV